MNLLANPIFLTQKRLIHRSGVLAPVLIALLIGLSLLAAFFNQCNLHPGVRAEWGHVYYGWVLGIQAAVLVIGGFSRISRTLVDERRAGLFDSNQLTPLSPADLVRGYWLGSVLRESYIAAVLVPIGLVMVLGAGLPVMLWVTTQALLITTALFFCLLAVLTGMVLKRAFGGGIGMLVFMLLGWPAIALAIDPKSLLSFLLPMYATLHLFGASDANNLPQLFGIPVPTLVLTWALQLFMSVLCWRAAVRKMSDPIRPAFTRPVAVLVFGVLSLVQHGLIWSNPWQPEIGVVHGSMLALGVALVGALSLKPDQARIMTLRLGQLGQQWTLRHSGPAVALVLSIVGSVTLVTHFVSSRAPSDWTRWLLTSVNLLTGLLSFAVLMELCRLQFRRKTAGIIALGVFVLYLLPFLLAIVFQSEDIAHFSMLATGVTALSAKTLTPVVIIATGAEVAVVAVLTVIWWNAWRKFLRPVAAT